MPDYLNAGLDENGRPVPLDLEPALRAVTALPFEIDGRYWDGLDGRVTCCWIDRCYADQQLRLATIRRSGLPWVEQGGSLSPLSIPDSAGLVEQVHVVFFPHMIVGSEFNFYGPRLSRLAGYLCTKAGGKCPPIGFQPLLRFDVMEQLAALRDIRLFHLKVHATYTQSLQEHDSDIGNYLGGLARVGEAKEVEIVLRPARSGHRSLSERFLGFAKGIAKRPDLRDQTSKFLVKGLSEDTGRVEVIDVLSDKLISKKQIVRQDDRTRALDAASAYEAIEEAYRELRPQLEAAAGVSL